MSQVSEIIWMSVTFMVARSLPLLAEDAVFGLLSALGSGVLLVELPVSRAIAALVIVPVTRTVCPTCSFRFCVVTSSIC